MKDKRNYTTLFTTELDLSDENIQAYKEEIAECNDLELDDVSDDDVYRLMYDDVDIDWDNFRSDCNVYDRKHRFSSYVVEGSLGLWDGRHNVIGESADLLGALDICIDNDSMSDIVIKEDQFGSMVVEYHHHDGCNIFTIKRKDDNKRYTQNIRFRKEVYGC